MQYIATEVNYSAKVQRKGHGYRASVVIDFDGVPFTEYGRVRFSEHKAYNDISDILGDYAINGR